LVAAAQEGGAEEKRNLGLAYLKGEQGLPRDLRSARFYVEEAAELGDPEAMFQLALMLRTGLGGLRNVPKAMDWLRDAETAGHHRAAPLADEIAASEFR
jgi:TPR repeat protein